MLSKTRVLTLCLTACSLYFWQPPPTNAIENGGRNSVARPSQQARQLASKVIEAYGGSEKIQNLNELMYKAKGVIKESSMLSNAENSFDCEIYARGDKTRVELNILGQTVVTGYNGSMSWVKQGDNVMPTDPATAKHIEAEVEHGMKLLDRLTDKDAYVALGETRTIAGKECPSLLIKASDGKFSRFFIDPQTYLVIRNEYQGLDLEQGLSAKKASEYSDYRSVFGTQLPFKTIEFNDGKKSTETSLSTFELVPNGSDSMFDMPVEVPIARLKQGVITIPFEYRANEIIIKARVNDKSDALLIVDTGATTTVFNAADATGFGTTTSSEFKMTTGSGTIKTGYIKLGSLGIADLLLKDVPVAVSDLQGFKELPGQKPIGIIGADVLRRFLLQIDYENKLITLSDPKDVKIPSDAAVIPTEPALGAAGLVVEGKLDGQPITMLVDTGAAFNNVSEKLVQKLIDGPLLPVGKVEGLDGQKISIGAVQFKNLKIGNTTIKDPVFSVAPRESAGVQKGIIVNGSLAILGNPTWSQFKLTVDYRHQRLFLQKSKAREQREQVAEDMREIDLRYYRNHDAATASMQMKDLSRRYEQKNWAAPSAVALAKSALYSAINYKSAKSGQGATSEQIDKINKDFATALEKATASGDKSSRTEVIAANAMFLLRYTKPPNYVAGKAMLEKGTGDAPNSVPLNLSTYWLVKQTRPSKASLVLDQVLMVDPRNWDALWAEYSIAKVWEETRQMTLIANQLKRYYSGIPDVDNLDTTSGAQSTAK